MPREFVCSYGNCEETKLPIVCSLPGNPGERARFCCIDHAAIAMIRRASLAAVHPSEKEQKLIAIERLMRDLVGDGRKVR